MSVSKAFNYVKVSDAVSTAGLLSEEQLRGLATEGYQAVINLLPHDSEYAIAGEAAIVEQQGITYEYIPVDFAAPTAADFKIFTDKLSALGDTKVMLHCAANYRVSAFYAVYAHRNLGWSQAQAHEFIGGIWDTSEHPVWEAWLAKMLANRQS